jgi:hypothetical protein
MVCRKGGRLAKTVIIYNSRTGNSGNVSEILKRRKKTYGKSKVLCPAAIALPI